MLTNTRGHRLSRQVNSFGIASRIMKQTGQRGRPRRRSSFACRPRLRSAPRCSGLFVSTATAQAPFTFETHSGGGGFCCFARFAVAPRSSLRVLFAFRRRQLCPSALRHFARRYGLFRPPASPLFHAISIRMLSGSASMWPPIDCSQLKTVPCAWFGMKHTHVSTRMA
jgi:hypothetical protein